ncbi:site-specific integrase [Streptomyces fradiae]|uniref:hypothetical protein n=1 Tax=Streptomyces fradiae TaxID=1906 RepID=UPI0037F4E553
MASVVLDTGCRVGELCALRLEDLSPAPEEVRITRRPQNRRPDTPVSVEVYPLRRGVAAPELHLVPPAPDAERAARFMAHLERAGRQLAALPDAESAPTADRDARRLARYALREAWREASSTVSNSPLSGPPGCPRSTSRAPDGNRSCCGP